ncbi:hypothetical protein CIW49_03585 [Mycolicibacterium sp. P1-18]|uniref:DUF7373 family lipoprotein n=1 Tax=Mycolicibacterium sp. P1-18 TaxID=2024615 RepID=UPI0011F124C1|nr:hypothetical protein [Mycolicibacterium sp. P1-18]KAA0102399.1 hypothetical protein CIW49_03585 [Mycolicibacterium sp. P1-18]
MGRGLTFGVVGACALIVVGCGGSGGGTSTSAMPSSSSASSTAAPRPVVNPALLDVGRYPTAPRPPLGVAGDPALGAVSDAQHLADFVIGPWEVDEKLVGTYLNSYYVLNSATVLKQLGPEGIATAAGQAGMINGFASARQDPDREAMVNAVLHFPDPAAATAASKAMGEAAARQAIKGITPTVVAVPGHTDAVASTYPFTPNGSTKTSATVRSFTPRGAYVFMHFVQSVDGVDRATGLVAKAIDAQGPRIDEFTPAGDLGAVPLDPTGLLAKTLPAAVSEPAKNAVYATRGAEHFQSNPLASETLFSDTGTTEVAMGNTNVYQTKDDGAAIMIINAFSQEMTSDGMAIADTVTALPDSHCYALPQAFYCVAPAGRYAIEARSQQLADVHQQLSAQYVMLTAK